MTREKKTTRTFKKQETLKQTSSKQNINIVEINKNITLNKKIVCSDDLKVKLSEETFNLCNQILPTVKVFDPGLLVQVLNKQDLHVALGLPNSPVPQGIDETTSEVAFRAWIVAQAHAIRANSQYPPHTDLLAFHHLSEGEAHQILLQRWQIIPWVNNVIQHVPALEMPKVLWLAGSGRGRAELTLCENIFG